MNLGLILKITSFALAVIVIILGLVLFIVGSTAVGKPMFFAKVYGALTLSVGFLLMVGLGLYAVLLFIPIPCVKCCVLYLVVFAGLCTFGMGVLANVLISKMGPDSTIIKGDIGVQFSNLEVNDLSSGGHKRYEEEINEMERRQTKSNPARDAIELYLKCCGGQGSGDYDPNPLPSSCCGRSKGDCLRKDAYEKGCVSEYSKWFIVKLKVLYGVSYAASILVAVTLAVGCIA